MDQHLVHHHLEEEGGDERKDLQEERRDDGLAEQLPVFHDGRHEPGEVELGQLASDGGARREEQRFARPARREIRDRQRFGARGPRALQEHLALLATGENQVIALDVDHQGRQREAFQPTGLAPDGLGLQTETCGGKQDLRRPECPPVLAELVGKLFRAGGHAMKARDHGQPEQPGVRRRCGADGVLLHPYPCCQFAAMTGCRAS